MSRTSEKFEKLFEQEFRGIRQDHNCSCGGLGEKQK
jgi:hypothetical protein